MNAGPTPEELERLLAGITYRRDFSAFENYGELRDLLECDERGQVLDYLWAAMKRMPEETRGAVVFIVAERLFQSGDERRLRELAASGDSTVVYYTLNGLWGKPPDSAKVGPLIVDLAISGAQSPDARVRAEVCRLLQNHCAWKVDVRGAAGQLPKLLADSVDSVRRAASFAVGHLAKRKYDLLALLPLLRRNAIDESIQVREGAAWALAQMTRAKFDIGSAVPELVAVLQTPDAYSELYRAATGALLHHAKKSSDARKQVRAALAKVRLDMALKTIKKFVGEIDAGEEE